MNSLSLRRLVVTALAVVGAGIVAVGPAAPAHSGLAGAKKRITPSGVDGVKLGKTYKQLRQQGLVKRIRKGCELGGPNTRSAGLRAPLKARSTSP